jgi:hypothetical protein
MMLDREIDLIIKVIFYWCGRTTFYLDEDSPLRARLAEIRPPARYARKTTWPNHPTGQREYIFEVDFMFENADETPEQKRERWKRQRKEFTDFVYRDLEELRRQRYS